MSFAARSFPSSPTWATNSLSEMALYSSAQQSARPSASDRTKSRAGHTPVVMAGKTALLASITCGLLCSQPLWAQAADDNDAVPDDAEEIIVRGRRLADFRAELQAARVRV